MTGEIKLPTYDAIIPNSVWGREAWFTEHHSSKEECPATQIIQILKYNIPSESDVIKIIQAAAKEVQLNLDNEEPRSLISRCLKGVPSEEVKKFAEGEKEILEHLKLHYSAPFQQRRTYILTLNGILPNNILDRLNDKVEKEEMETLFGGLIMRTGKKRWFSAIRLDGRGNLPSKKELEFLLEKGVRDCHIFRTDATYKNYQDMAEQSRLIYDAINTQENIQKIKDYSDKMLETYTMNTLADTVECILSQKVIGGFARGIMGLLGGLGGGFGGSFGGGGPGGDFPFQDDGGDDRSRFGFLDYF